MGLLPSIPTTIPEPERDRTSWYDVPDEVKSLLLVVAQHWEDSVTAERYMRTVLARPDITLDVWVSAYRYFFYKHNHAMALQIATQVIEIVRSQEQLPQDWEHLKPILEHRRQDFNIRLYVNAYAASGLMRARLGQTEQALKIAAHVKEIDPQRESCATTVWDVLTNPDEEEEE